MILQNFVAFSEYMNFDKSTFLNLFCHFVDKLFLSGREIPKQTDSIEYLRHAAVKRIGLAMVSRLAAKRTF